MASLSVRKIDDDVYERLRIRAAKRGVSMEEEVRQILRRAVSAPERLGDLARNYFGDDGDMQNSTFLDYRMPTALDLPMIDTVILEVPNPGHPFGVRGVGEVSLVPPMGAIANAIYDATGVRMTDLPMSPGSIVEALQKAKE